MKFLATEMPKAVRKIGNKVKLEYLGRNANVKVRIL